MISEDTSCATSPYNLLPYVLKTFSLPDTITIYDSTLRDGEQMPGVSYSIDQKLAIAKTLDDMNIPEIEVGFPAISEEEQHTIKTIANEGLSAKTLVLSRLKKEDVDAARKADADLVLLFIASSPLHLQYKLHCSKEKIKELMEQTITYAMDHGMATSFSTEDSTRSDLHFLEELVTTAFELDVERIGFTDTLGCATPQTIDFLYSHMRGLIPTPFSAHLHNDFGLALPNALAALNAGATHVCTTVNGWGERAGNVSLEQLVMTLQVLYDIDLGVDTSKFYELSQMLAKFTGKNLSPTQPFVGDQAFSHESGIHVAAMLEHQRTYEAIPPELVGNKRQFILGKHTGKHLVKTLLDNKNIDVDDQTLMQITQTIKNYGAKHGGVTEEDLEAIFSTI